MKIAQITPLYESIPPKKYGGTERIVHYLTEELIKQGHHITLFASGDSKTSAELVPVCDKALRLDSNCYDPIAYHFIQLQMVQSRISDFDLLHYHTDYLHFPSSVSNNKKNLTTLHGRLDILELKNVYNIYNQFPLVSISNNQRQPIPAVNWVGTVYHGLPEELYNFYPNKGKYLAFIGRIAEEKGVERAIIMAKKAGIKLIIAAKISKVDEIYFQKQIKHLLKDPIIEFVGEIDEKSKGSFLGNAMALLFPINWPEPFGLVMIEAMACGTPVIAFNNGSVPEIIEDKQTGFIVNSIEEGILAINKIDTIDRKKCRLAFEERFTASRMANDYLTIYDQLLKNNGHS